MIELLLVPDIWQHLVDPGVIGRLKHDASMSRVHLINAQRSVVAGTVRACLLSHPVGHEESLICFLCTQHSIDSLSWRLALSSSELLATLVHESISQWAVGHGVLVEAILFEIGHHVSQSGLRG